MLDLTIRPVTPADIDICYAIEAACFGPEGAPRERIAQRIAVYPAGFLVAELRGQVVGFVNSGATDKDDIADEAFKDLVGHDPAGRNIAIFSLAVAPACQRQGISRTLMCSFIATAKRLDKATVLLLCKAELIGYYQQYGFVDRGPSASTHGGLAWHELVLALRDMSEPASSAESSTERGLENEV